MRDDIRIPRDLAARLVDDFAAMHAEDMLPAACHELVLWLADNYPDLVSPAEGPYYSLVGYAYLATRKRAGEALATSTHDVVRLTLPKGQVGLVARGVAIEKLGLLRRPWRLTARELVGPMAVFDAFRELFAREVLRPDLILAIPGGGTYRLRDVSFDWPMTTSTAAGGVRAAPVTITAATSEYMHETADEGAGGPVG